MKKGWIALAVVLVSAAGCAQHPKGYDDARAACQSEAIEQMETAGVKPDQRPEWQENYIEDCMQKKGMSG